MQILIKGKQVAMLISDEVDFTAKQITRDREILYNNKRANPPIRHTNPKCLRIKDQSCKICEANTENCEGK